jgi:hypothetical protein
LNSFLVKVFAVHVENNLSQTAPLSTPLPIYTITLSHFNILFHIQIATRFSVTPVSTSFLCDLYQSGPFRRSNTFCHSMKQAHSSSSVPKIRCDITLSIPLLSFILTHLLHVYPQFHSHFLSKYPRYYLCNICDETECAKIAAVCSLWLLLQDNHCNTRPLCSFMYVAGNACRYSETVFCASQRIIWGNLSSVFTSGSSSPSGFLDHYINCRSLI